MECLERALLAVETWSFRFRALSLVVFVDCWRFFLDTSCHPLWFVSVCIYSYACMCKCMCMYAYIRTYSHHGRSGMEGAIGEEREERSRQRYRGSGGGGVDVGDEKDEILVTGDLFDYIYMHAYSLM